MIFVDTWAWLALAYKKDPFVDFTSMVVMQDLRITEVFTGDAHFQQVGLGFSLLP